MEVSSYRYEQLQAEEQEIRLVHLLPGRFEDDIKVRILHAPLLVPSLPPPKKEDPQVQSIRASVTWPWEVQETEDGDSMIFNVVTGQTYSIPVIVASSEYDTTEYQPRYEALSYTWGDAEISEFCQVEDSQNNGIVLGSLGLRPSLASALRYLRYPDATRVLWIDAMCINQEDIEERNEQVKRMTHIYKLAHHVVAWLGEEANDSKLALEALHHIGRQLEATRSGRIIASPDATEPHLWRNDQPVSFDHRTWQALDHLLQRGWFYRLWCWQEIKLSSSHTFLQCGNDVILWKKLWQAVLCLHGKDNVPSMRFREHCRHIAFLNHDAEGHSLSNILDISRSKGCANPRDKIYGLLGITPKYFSSNINVDYLGPLEDVYKEAFLTHSNATKWLELLKHCNLIDRQIGGPSWVPDWSKTEFAAPIMSEQLSSGLSRAWFTYEAPNVLEVIGKQYTTIKLVTGMASKTEEETLLAVGDWFKYLPKRGQYVTGEAMEVAFALTLCMSRTRERHPYSRCLSVKEWVSMLHDMLTLNAKSQNHPVYSARETTNTIQKIRGRQFFITETGHIGTVPAGAQSGK